ncbi:MAG: NTP transferase domain-containing protein [Acholeplasmatales bacterium]|jgi:glucose-1-phosphate thymidylyltransferase|nr:NTP transferase domain-containing protein [Acholeplasmatales bacterium]
MKVVILCAGYATRLYPKTLHTPKALLEYQGKRILDYLIEDLKHSFIDEIILVSNHKFYSLFLEYSKNKGIKVIDDGSTCNENRIGAGNDLILGIQEIDDDCLVMACDNLLDFSLSCFIDYFYIDKVSSIMCYKEKDEEKLKRTGQAVLCENRVMDFKEKPSISISNFAVPPFYIFNKEDIKVIKGLKGSYDSLGSIIEEVVNKIHLKAYKMVGKRLDLGN